MTGPGSRAQRRHWADIVTIVTGVTLLGLVVWGSPVMTTGSTLEMRYPDWVWMLQLAAGALALVAVWLAQRPRSVGLARAALALAGIVLLVGLAAFRDFGWRAWLTMVLPGVLLLAAARFIGPMPAPK